MLCPKCGKFMGRICFPPIPTCQCKKPFDLDYDENQPSDELDGLLEGDSG